MTLTIEHLDVSYGRTQVIFDLSLEVGDGEVVCVLGRNGVGKTTLLNAIMGLLPTGRGRITFDGDDITDVAPHRRARLGLGYVPQGHARFPSLTTRQNLDVVARRNGAPEAGVIDEVLGIFPALASVLDRPAGLLSGGQAQQLAIARALVTRPKILILDEPTEGIQPSIIIEIEDTIAALHERTGMAIVLVEQYVDFALRLADTYAVIDAGRIIAAGRADESADPASFTALIAI